jgi:hypothetical protein
MGGFGAGEYGMCWLADCMLTCSTLVCLPGATIDAISCSNMSGRGQLIPLGNSGRSILALLSILSLRGAPAASVSGSPTCVHVVVVLPGWWQSAVHSCLGRCMGGGCKWGGEATEALAGAQ